MVVKASSSKASRVSGFSLASQTIVVSVSCEGRVYCLLEGSWFDCSTPAASLSVEATNMAIGLNMPSIASLRGLSVTTAKMASLNHNF